MNIPCLLVACGLLVSSPYAVSAEAQPQYGPFEGAGYLSVHGYQELKLGPEQWYVAYQGNQTTSPSWVEAAWSARAAQLCKATGATHFVEMRYPFEAITRADQLKASRSGMDEVGSFILMAGPVFIPIYTPSGPRTIVPLNAPSKLASVRCVMDVGSVSDPSRVVSIDAAMTDARKQGVSVPP